MGTEWLAEPSAKRRSHVEKRCPAALEVRVGKRGVEEQGVQGELSFEHDLRNIVGRRSAGELTSLEWPGSLISAEVTLLLMRCR
jgi:hypothetical protein